MLRRSIPAVLALALLVPRAADAGVLTIEGLYGVVWPPEANFEAATGAIREGDLSEDTLQIAGGDLLLSFGGFQVGAIVDTTFGDGPSQTAIGGLVGFRLGDKLRLDLLGEAGGHRFGNVFEDQNVVRGTDADQWLFYVGLRPGFAYRFGTGKSGVIVGVWGFVRWDVTDERVPVTVGTANDRGDLDLGGTTVGATLRFGFEL